MESPLHKAVTYGNVQAVQDLITSGVKIDVRTQASETPLHYAAAYNRVPIAGASIGALFCIFNTTPFHFAAKFGGVEFIKLLIEKGAKIDVNEGKEGSTALHLAVKRKHFEIVKMIVESGANVNAQNFHRQSTLEIAFELDRLDGYSEKKKGQEIAIYLVEKGARGNTRNL